jgi:predicted DCC family thiol-disulfide oxidoreductase YuxK
MATKTLVIYDGECEFCKSCATWISMRIEIDALSNQSIEPQKYGITREQCEKSVVVIDNGVYLEAKAIAHLLEKSGHNFLANLIRSAGPIGTLGYRYVASNRDGRLVAFLHWIIRKTA